jgi:hypothetical protein
MVSGRCRSSFVKPREEVVSANEQATSDARDARKLRALGHRVDGLARGSEGDRDLARREERRPPLRKRPRAMRRAEGTVALASARRRVARIRLASGPALVPTRSNVSFVHTKASRKRDADPSA